MFLKKSVFFLFISLVILSTGCKKDEKVCTLDQSGIAGSFVFTSVNINGVEVLNDLDYFELCERDDVYTFNTNGTFTITDGPLICTEPSVDSGFWTLTGNTLSLDGEAGTVSDFTCSGFTWTFSEPGFTSIIKLARQ